MRLPTTNPITPGYGYGSTLPPYSGSNQHAGTDYSYYPNPIAYAPEQVKITRVGYLGDCGLAVDYSGADGRTYRNCHASEVYVSVGQVCNEGDKLHKMGATGAASGAHLHFVMWVNGTRLDGDKEIKRLMGGKKMTGIEFDTFIAETYQKIAARIPTDAEFNFHRQQYAAQGDKWCLEMVKGFKGDDWAWKVYERNLNDATKKIEELSKDGAKLTPGKYIVG